MCICESMLKYHDIRVLMKLRSLDNNRLPAVGGVPLRWNHFSYFFFSSLSLLIHLFFYVVLRFYCFLSGCSGPLSFLFSSFTNGLLGTNELTFQSERDARCRESRIYPHTYVRTPGNRPASGRIQLIRDIILLLRSASCIITSSGIKYTEQASISRHSITVNEASH